MLHGVGWCWMKFVFHQTSYSTSSKISSVFRCEKQCCIRLATVLNLFSDANFQDPQCSMFLQYFSALGNARLKFKSFQVLWDPIWTMMKTRMSTKLTTCGDDLSFIFASHIAAWLLRITYDGGTKFSTSQRRILNQKRSLFKQKE